jgi:uncharacterized protein YggU (UPF0235/DUF167 family)
MAAGNDAAARIRIRAIPGSRACVIVGPYGDAWKVRVTAAPEQGKANAELCSYLATLLGVARGDVTVIGGAGSRDKLVQITGITSDAAASALAQAAGGK